MKKKLLLFLMLFCFLFNACQKDETTVIQNTADSFVKSSPISSLIMRVSQNETSLDNVIDGTSCFRVQLPVSLNIDSQYVHITSNAGYATVQNIKNSSTTDDDQVNFIFPITIVYANYQQVEVASQSQFNIIIAQCGNSSSFEEISCIDFNFPFDINNYNSSNQIGSTITINNDSQLYNYLHSLGENDIVGIAFPITLTDSNTITTIVNSDSQLEDLIDSVVDDCNTTSVTLELVDVLTNGTWYVSYCYYDQDDTVYYNGYHFTFENNGDVEAEKNSTVIDGDWDIHDESDYQRLDLNFDGSQLYELETGWKVMEYNETNVRLKKQNSDSTYYLNFTKN